MVSSTFLMGSPSARVTWLFLLKVMHTHFFCLTSYCSMPILPQYILWVPWHFAYFLQLSGCRQRKVVLGSSYVARIFYALDHCFCVLHPQIIRSSLSQTDTVKAGSLGECRNVVSSNHWFYCCVLSWTWGFHRVLECYQSFFCQVSFFPMLRWVYCDLLYQTPFPSPGK